MSPFLAAMKRMDDEVAAGTALYHFEDDGTEYTLHRNGVAVAGISHAYAAQVPGLTAAIESAFSFEVTKQ